MFEKGYMRCQKLIDTPWTGNGTLIFIKMVCTILQFYPIGPAARVRFGLLRDLQLYKH